MFINTSKLMTAVSPQPANPRATGFPRQRLVVALVNIQAVTAINCTCLPRLSIKQRLVVACDNMQAVTAVNTGRASSPFAQRILRDIWFLEAKYDFSMRAAFISRVDNRISDYLSRWDLSAAHHHHFLDLTAGYHLQEYTVTTDLFQFDTEYSFYAGHYLRQSLCTCSCYSQRHYSIDFSSASLNVHTC